MQPQNKATTPCPVCGGKGFFPAQPPAEDGVGGRDKDGKPFAVQQVCVTCGGTGKGGYRTK